MRHEDDVSTVAFKDELMKRSATGPQFSRAILLLLALLSLVLAGHAAARESAAQAHAPQWQSAPPGTRLSSNAPNGADGPLLAKSPDGSHIMVAYNRRVTNAHDRDPYIRTFDGQSWSATLPVHVTAGTDTALLALSYGADNVAHLIWDEPNVGLRYSRYQGGAWSAPKLIAAASERLFGADISVSGSQIVDVVWAAKPHVTQNPNVYHARSTNGGVSWSTPAPIAETLPTSAFPKVMHSANGSVHAVWQEGTAAPGSAIHYARGLPWSDPISITPLSIVNARRPSLAVAGNSLHVAFTLWQAEGTSESDQWAYYTQCSSNCTVVAQWSVPLNASGQAVRVNESAPFDLITDLTHHSGCNFAFFHGYIQAVSPNEVVWNVNSCDGWSGGGRNQVTGYNMRGLYPHAVMHNNTVHLVYEWVNGNDHQIYYMQGVLPAGSGTIYLPFVTRS